jgi:hypothetical protein
MAAAYANLKAQLAAKRSARTTGAPADGGDAGTPRDAALSDSTGANPEAATPATPVAAEAPASSTVTTAPPLHKDPELPAPTSTGTGVSTPRSSAFGNLTASLAAKRSEKRAEMGAPLPAGEGPDTATAAAAAGEGSTPRTRAEA